MKFKGKVKGDLLLVVVLVIIGVSVLLYNQVIVPKKGQATRVIVEIEGEVVQELDLGKDIDQGMALIRWRLRMGRCELRMQIAPTCYVCTPAGVNMWVNSLFVYHIILLWRLSEMT